MPPPSDVVEIGLLLPVSWADALLRMSRRRQQSVGELLRGMIDRALFDEDALDR
jgi:hypothetical protein